jgi:hypothetical protein
MMPGRRIATPGVFRGQLTNHTNPRWVGRTPATPAPGRRFALAAVTSARLGTARGVGGRLKNQHFLALLAPKGPLHGSRAGAAGAGDHAGGAAPAQDGRDWDVQRLCRPVHAFPGDAGRSQSVLRLPLDISLALPPAPLPTTNNQQTTTNNQQPLPTMITLGPHSYRVERRLLSISLSFTFRVDGFLIIMQIMYIIWIIAIT